jgi:nucleotide-binding universal stress UspA family protein
MYRHLLVPTDGSELSQQAVDAAIAMARESGAAITFFHVQPSFYGRPDVALYGEGLVLDPLLSEQFSKANAEAQQHGVLASGETCVNPVIYEAILDAAAQHHCDLILMASHGRRGLAGLVLGSETQRVLTHAALPVLVIPSRAQG